MTRTGTIALVGRPNVGKSTLLNALLGEKIAATTHKPQTTRRSLRGVLTQGEDQFVFIDTPGLHKEHGPLHAFMIEEALDAARSVDVVVLVVEAFLKKTPQGPVADVDRRDLIALEALAKEGRDNIVLVVNKIDRFADKAMVLPLLQAWSGQGSFAALVPVSAQDKEGLDVFLEALGENLQEGPFLFDPDALTDASERDIAAEIIREKAMLELTDELPYRVAVRVEEFDEARRDDAKKPLVHIEAVLFVEREGQKRIVVGKGGERIKTIGMRARKDLQRLLGCQVMLQLFVKVEPGWSESDKGLAKVGYSR